MFLCINFTMFHVDLFEFFRGYFGVLFTLIQRKIYDKKYTDVERV